MDDKQRIALVETRTLDTAGNDQAPRQLIRYQFGNHLGSASLELDEQAQIISYEEYAPYGSSTYQAVRSQTETAKRYRYTGKERDEESGLYYQGARYYSAFLGGWVSADPIGISGGMNIYAYARRSPINYRDRDGRAPEDFAAGKAWEKEILGKLKEKISLVEQVTVTAEIDGKKVTSVLDGLGKTGDGWVVIESKLSDPTLREAQEQIRKHLLGGGSVTVSASTPEKIAELQKTLGISSKSKIATQSYDVVTKGTASQVLSKYNAIPEGYGTLLHKTGEIEYLSPDQRNAFEKLRLESPGKDAKQIMADVRRLENEAKLVKLAEEGGELAGVAKLGKRALMAVPLVDVVAQQVFYDELGYGMGRPMDAAINLTVAEIWEVPMAVYSGVELAAKGLIAGGRVAADAGKRLLEWTSEKTGLSDLERWTSRQIEDLYSVPK